MIISIHPNVLKKIENNLVYCYNLLNLLNESYFSFREKYEKYINVKKNLYKDSNLYKLCKYDNIIINITYIEIFKLYFLNMNTSIKNNQISYVSTEFLSQLENDSEFDDFYGKVLFNYNNDANGLQKINKLYIYIIDKVIYKLINKKWFTEYFTYADIYGLVQYVVKTWTVQIIEYIKLSEEKNEEIAINTTLTADIL